MEGELFAQAVDDLKEGSIDYAESKLMMNIRDGKEKSIFYFLTHKAKSRGYGKGSQEIVHGVMPSLIELVKEYRAEQKKKKQAEKQSE